jgi:hypothetical protein
MRRHIRFLASGRFVLLWFALTLFASGCARQQGTNRVSSPVRYPSKLSSASDPREVAQVLIKALDEDDKAALAGLVAAEAERAAIEEIYARYGRTHRITPWEAANLAASGWRATYVFFEPGATQVTEGQVEGDTATVRAQGRNASTGRPRVLVIHLAREGGLWKVLGGLESADP